MSTLARDKTRPVNVAHVKIGGGAPVVVQSMTNVPMLTSPHRTEPVLDVEGNLSQIDNLRDAGCELVRVAVPNRASLDAFASIAQLSSLPVIADVHFDYKIALGVLARHACGLRINPGNIGSLDRVDAVIDAAGSAQVPIRIGVNAGSLSSQIAARQDLSLSQKLVVCACDFAQHFYDRGFKDIVISAKAHDVNTTVEAYRELARALPQVPLHLGITEAGTLRQGAIKSAVGCGILLSEGIGDTMRVSLTADVLEEVEVAYNILSALGLRYRGPELISCPTCSRCQVDLIAIVHELEGRLATLRDPIKVAVMGCVVNGPGEARDADLGVACGRDEGLIFAKGKALKKVPAQKIVDALLEQIAALESGSRKE